MVKIEWGKHSEKIRDQMFKRLLKKLPIGYFWWPFWWWYIGVISPTIRIHYGKWFLKVFPTWWWLPSHFARFSLRCFPLVSHWLALYWFRSFWCWMRFGSSPAKAAASFGAHVATDPGRSQWLYWRNDAWTEKLSRSLTMNTLSCRNLMLWMTSCNPVLQKPMSMPYTLMPIMMNLLNVQYVLIATIGGLLAINGVSGLTVGMIASFLQLSRSLNGPISQISQQINFCDHGFW